MTDFRPAQSPAEREVAAIPCNCWLDDEPPCPSPCVFDDPREEVNNCCYATMIQSANRKKTDCKYYRAASVQLGPEVPGPTHEETWKKYEDTSNQRPTDQELAETARKAVEGYRYTTELPYFLSEDSCEFEPFMLALRAVLDRWGRPAAPLQPVPVSERLPDPRPEAEGGDCDAEGRCWWFCLGCPGEYSYWILAKEVYCNPTLEQAFWRPFSALPLPTTTTTTTTTEPTDD